MHYLFEDTNFKCMTSKALFKHDVCWYAVIEFMNKCIVNMNHGGPY